MIRPLLAGLLTLVLAAPVAAQDQTVLQVGLGVTRLDANELVYEGRDRVSRLIWKSRVPVLQLGLRHDLPQGWTLAGRLVTSLDENSEMADYDWLAPFATGTGPDDWTDRSLHPDTGLREYIDLEVTLGRRIATLGQTRIGLHGGLKYTEASWRARGGTYIYSEEGFRDTIGAFEDGSVGIDYLQRHKAIFAGIEAIRTLDAWSLGGHLRAGLSLEPRAVDYHWEREVRFDDSMETQPYVAIALIGQYSVTPTTVVGIEAGWQRFVRRRGDGRALYIYDPSSFELLPDGAGADLTAAIVSLSVTSSF